MKRDLPARVPVSGGSANVAKSTVVPTTSAAPVANDLGLALAMISEMVVSLLVTAVL